MTQSCPALCDPMDYSMPGFSVLHYLPEFAQTHVHWISNAMQPSPLSSPSPPAFNLSQHQGLFQTVVSSHQVAKVVEFQLQRQSFQIIFRIDLIFLLSKGLSRVFSSTTVWKHQFFSAQPSLWSNSHPYMTTGKTTALTIWTFVSKVLCLCFTKLSRFVIAFLPKSKHLLISWLQSLPAVILGPKKIKSVTVSTFPPFICQEVMALHC